jgi:TolB-like protein
MIRDGSVSGTGMRQFLGELKRRNVIRIAGLYLVGAWLVIQVAGTLLPMFEAPAWVSRSVVALLVAGLVPALIFSWVFELTPEGLKRDADVPPDASIAPQTARRMDRSLLLVSALALAYFAFDKFALAPRRDAALVATTTRQVTEQRAQSDSAINPRSIAVLPFVNMSDDASNEYFSDGISEELLNVLARTPALQVAARTSSFSFKGGKHEIPEIARELKVRMVLEGSVRRQGERVRITAQLIDAANGFHVWSETYDRKLQDVFAIQDEIANAIADQLKVKLVGREGGAETSRGTRNVEAHDRYLRGLALWQERGEKNLFEALDEFRRASAADPAFVEAYAGQALVNTILPDYSAKISYDESLGRARDNAERALSLDPTLPEPYVVLGYLADGDRRHATAQALYRRAIELRPSFVTAYHWFGNSLWSVGKLDEGRAMLERAAALDPRSVIVANNLAMVLIALDRNRDAIDLCAPILKTPLAWHCQEPTGLAALQLGDHERARTAFSGYADAVNPSARAEIDEVFDAIAGRGDRHAIAVRLAKFMPQSATDPKSGNAFQPYVLPSVLVALGEPRLALANLQAFADTDRAGVSEWAVMMPGLGALHCDPEFVALVARIATSDPHHARLCAQR